MKQQIIASLLAMCLVAGLLPTAALAAEDEVPDSGIPIVCTMDKNCKAESHDEGCPLYVTPEEPVEDAEEPLAEGSESPAPADPAVTALQKRINALPGVAELAEVDEDEWAAVYEEVCAIYDAIDELTSKEAEALDMSVLEAAAAFFTQQIMPLDGGNDATAMSGNCGLYDYTNKKYIDTVKWTLTANDEDGYTLTISGNGPMGNAYITEDNVSSGEPEWHSSREKITRVVIQDGVTSVGAKSFKNYTNLKTVVLPASITKIGQDSFYGSGITSITLPANLTTVEPQAFYKCSSLNGTISVPVGVVSIPSYTFAATGISSIEFNGAVTEIGVNAFMGCRSLTSITLPDTVTTIAPGAFSNCIQLGSCVFPENLQFTKISKETFKGCTELEEVLIPSSVTEIAESAFQGCTNLKRVVLSNNLNTIGSMAFKDASLMEGVYIPASVSSIPENNQIFKGMANNSVIYLGSSDLISLMLQSKTNPTSTSNGYDSDKTSLAVTDGGTFSADTEFTSGTLATPSKEGYSFGGWYADENCTGNTVTTPEAGKTYYAKWVSEITFDSNGGTGSMDTQRIAETDTSTNLTKNTFTRDGYEFSGWNTAADGSGTSYNDEATGAGANGKITLYAQWTKKIGENSYTVNAILDQTYTGSEIKPAVVVKNSGTVLSSGYTVTYSNNTDVGTAKATVAIGSDTAEVEFKIVKDENPIVEMADQSVTYGTEYTMTATAKTSAGNEITGGAITIQYYTDESCTTGETDTAPTSAGTYYAKATLTGTDNYAEATKTAKITISNATFSVSATGYDGTYDGRAHSITVEADNDVTVTYCKTENGDYTSEKPEYTDAGEYTVYYKASKANHNDVTGSATVKIAKVQTSLTLTADPAKMTGAGTVKLTLSSTGIPETETIAAPTCEGVTVAANSDGTYSVSLLNETKEYTFAVSYAGDGNHEAAEATCTVSVTRRSSGGGGSSSGGSSSGNTTTEAEKNPDGSTTTTVTDKKTGTVTETTKFKDGSTLVVETKKDGTVTTTETAKNGVKVKTVDEPGENVTAAVTIPKSVGTATVTIPADVDYGMVAVDAETGEIVKLSVPTEDGMTVKLDGSAELVLVDNVKDFADTSGHWAQDGVDFATAHELFSGTSATTFAPDSPMTRAMLMTVLARFDGEDTVGGSVWYEKGMAWAVANGVSDGTDPDGSITREQLATMLYRYMGAPGTGGSIDYFTDSANVSGYAVDAMRWSVETGLISGMGDGSLNPQGNATRAQVAVILMRFTENLTK